MTRLIIGKNGPILLLGKWTVCLYRAENRPGEWHTGIHFERYVRRGPGARRYLSRHWRLFYKHSVRPPKGYGDRVWKGTRTLEADSWWSEKEGRSNTRLSVKRFLRLKYGGGSDLLVRGEYHT